MPAPPGQPLNIFLSCVSSQFRPCRDDLASALRTVGYKVTVQEDFPLTDFFLLEKLQNFIASCDLVIALIGDAYGFEPEVRTSPRRSYTQWEYHFALGERLSFAHDSSPVLAERQPTIPVRRYFASLDYLAAHPVTQPDELKTLQDAFIQSIHQSNKDWDKFSTCHELRANVLRDLSKPLRHEHRPNNLPYPTLGSLFVGREQFLTDLRASLTRATDSSHATAIVQTQAVHGLGGIGKTRLAVEYAWQHATDYSALLFVVADSPENLHRNLAALCGPLVLNLPEKDAPQEEVRIAAALRWLQSNRDWLLILDNVDSPEAATAAEELLARLTRSQVLLTTRLAQWGASVTPLELNILEPEASIRFLLDRTKHHRSKLSADPEDAVALARELDGLALALEQAAAYIDERRTTFQHYLAEWRAHNQQVQGWYNPRLMKYPRSVAVTWHTTLAQLGEVELQTLALLAWLAPDPIPMFLFDTETAKAIFSRLSGGAHAPSRAPTGAPAGRPTLSPTILGTAPNPACHPPATFRDALVTLANYSLLKFDDDQTTFTVHRVLQEIARNQIADTDKKPNLAVALGLLNAAGTGDPTDVRNWPVWNPLRPHLEHLLPLADAERIAEPTALLLNELGLLLHTKALDAEAEPLLRRALAIDEQYLGCDHPDVARDLSNLAGSLQATNHLAEAELLYRRSLGLTEQRSPIDYASLGIQLNNLAQLLLHTNRRAEAESLMHRALATSELHLGSDHPNLAVQLNNLARLFQINNLPTQAEPLLRRALTISQQSFGPDHPKVATALTTLAELLQATSRLAEAEPLMRRALAISEQSFGSDHPEVALRLNNLAVLLQETHQLTEAECLIRRAVAIWERNLGESHPNLAYALHNLALLLRATQRFAEAELLMHRTLAIWERSLGENHPNVATVLGNLAQLLQTTQRLTEAESLMNRALIIDEHSFGSNHPKVARDLNNLFGLRQITNREAEAEPLICRALKIVLDFTRTTGHRHPHLNKFRDNYFVLLTQMGDTPAQAQAKLAALAQPYGVSLG